MRRARREDIPFIVDIITKGWQVAYEGIVDNEYLRNMDNERGKRITKIESVFDDNCFVVAELNKEIVGFCRYVTDNSFSPENKDADCEIIAIYVRPDLKYCGIGTKMFIYVMNELRKMDRAKMILWCLKDNESSKEFYAKMGGIIIGEKIMKIGGKDYRFSCFLYDL